MSKYSIELEIRIPVLVSVLFIPYLLRLKDLQIAEFPCYDTLCWSTDICAVDWAMSQGSNDEASGQVGTRMDRKEALCPTNLRKGIEKQRVIAHLRRRQTAK